MPVGPGPGSARNRALARTGVSSVDDTAVVARSQSRPARDPDYVDFPLALQPELRAGDGGSLTFRQCPRSLHRRFG
jgi:hypothetical protein